MQIKKEQLKLQQMIMSALGFYRNTCDGIWGPASIASKRKWEMDKSFIPGLPNSGLPLSEDSLYPKGVTLDAKSKLFGHARLTSDLIASFEAHPAAQPSASIPEVLTTPPVTALTATLVTSSAPAEEVSVEQAVVAGEEATVGVVDTDSANLQRALQNQNRHKQRR
jgi:hypothetical protein